MAMRSLSIGFKGGQVIAVRVEEDQVDALYQMLGSSGWHALDAEDGLVRLDLAQIIFVRSDDGEHRVGFRA
jgi:hypothetical protein